MSKFSYGGGEPKTVKVTSHDGREIEVPASFAPLYKQTEQAAPKPASKKEA